MSSHSITQAACRASGTLLILSLIATSEIATRMARELRASASLQRWSSCGRIGETKPARFIQIRFWCVLVLRTCVNLSKSRIRLCRRPCALTLTSCSCLLRGRLSVHIHCGDQGTIQEILQVLKLCCRSCRGDHCTRESKARREWKDYRRSDAASSSGVAVTQPPPAGHLHHGRQGSRGVSRGLHT